MDAELQKLKQTFDKTSENLKKTLFHSAKSAATASLIKQTRNELKDAFEDSELDVTAYTTKTATDNIVIMNKPTKESAAEVLEALYDDMFPGEKWK